MDLTMTFPGGKRVDARAGEYTISTDQPVSDGGEGGAPAPFTLFLASVGTCAGLYVLGYCQARGIPTDGIRVEQHSESDPKTKRLTRLDLSVIVPPSFPAESREALARAAAACKVKKTIFDPPLFSVATVVEGQAEAGERKAG